MQAKTVRQTLSQRRGQFDKNEDSKGLVGFVPSFLIHIQHLSTLRETLKLVRLNVDEPINCSMEVPTGTRKVARDEIRMNFLRYESCLPSHSSNVQEVLQLELNQLQHHLPFLLWINYNFGMLAFRGPD
jgi:hypothetical protein